MPCSDDSCQGVSAPEVDQVRRPPDPGRFHRRGSSVSKVMKHVLQFVLRRKLDSDQSSTFPDLRFCCSTQGVSQHALHHVGVGGHRDGVPGLHQQGLNIVGQPWHLEKFKMTELMSIGKEEYFGISILNSEEDIAGRHNEALRHCPDLQR